MILDCQYHLEPILNIDVTVRNQSIHGVITHGDQVNVG